MISFDQAVILTAGAARPRQTETVPLTCAHRRTLAADVRARQDSPLCDVAAMDGYAVRDRDLHTVPTSLRVAGKSFAGDIAPGRIGAGECMRIFTGAPMPENGERVIVQESVDARDGQAVFSVLSGPSRHMRERGSDFAAGDILLRKGRTLDYRALVAVAAGDTDHVEVWRRPRVTVLATGDELAEPGKAHATPGRLPESVSFGVQALAEDWGGQAIGRERLADDLVVMRITAEAALATADVVVVTGGASVGERDFAQAMFEPAGLELIFAKVAIKPGKPVWLGRVGETLVLGLPGNPTSALVTARLFLAPLLAGLSGRDPAEALAWRPVPLATPLPSVPDRETFVRARRDGTAAEPLFNQDSSAQRTLAEATFLLRRTVGSAPTAQGDLVDAIEL